MAATAASAHQSFSGILGSGIRKRIGCMVASPDFLPFLVESGVVSLKNSVSKNSAGLFLGALLPVIACVPTGNAPPYDAGAQPTTVSTFRPSVNVMTAPFEDNFDRPDGGEALALPGDASSTSLTIDAALDAQK